jgi:hypothetical protein
MVHKLGGMNTTPPNADPVAALRHLTIEQIEQRLAELDGERASLSLLRRSLVARRRAEQRQSRRTVPIAAEGQSHG